MSIYVLILFCVSQAVMCNPLRKELCDYNDEQCLTKSTAVLYPKIVAGRPGKVEPSDPLTLNSIKLDVSDLNCTLSEAKLSGLEGCTVKDVKVNPLELYFVYYIWCPSLTMESKYDMIGQLDGEPINGKGPSKISYGEYHIWLRGYYSKYIDTTEDLHTQISRFTLDVNSEDIKPDFSGVSFGDNAKKGDDIKKKNLEKLEKLIRQPLMYKFIEKYIKNINAYLKIVPIKDIHYQLVDE